MIGSITLYRNAHRATDKDPDYWGKATFDGEAYSVTANRPGHSWNIRLMAATGEQAGQGWVEPAGRYVEGEADIHGHGIALAGIVTADADGKPCMALRMDKYTQVEAERNAA